MTGEHGTGGPEEVGRGDGDTHGRSAQRRRRRRVDAPATDGIPEEERTLTAPTPDPATDPETGPAKDWSDRWWQEQRPPHWG